MNRIDFYRMFDQDWFASMSPDQQIWLYLAAGILGFVVMGAVFGFVMNHFADRYLNRRREGLAGSGFLDQFGRDLTTLGDTDDDLYADNPELLTMWVRATLETRLYLAKEDLDSPALRTRLVGYGVSADIVEAVETLLQDREITGEQAERIMDELEEKLPKR